MKRRQSLLFVILVVLSAPPALAVEDPHFEVSVQEPTLAPGERQSMTVLLSNDAEVVTERAETAENVWVNVGPGDTPIRVLSGERSLGGLEDGENRAFTVRVEVPPNTPAGRYRLPVYVTYEVDGERQTDTVYATVRIPERPRFVIKSTNVSASVGGAGTANVTVTNVGSATAHEAAFTLYSAHPGLTIGQGDSVSRHVGNWEAGETKTLQYEVTVSPNATNRSYALAGRVTYKTPRGALRNSTRLNLGLTPLPAQRFDVRNVESTLRVDEVGEVRGRVVNRGPLPVENAVVVVKRMAVGVRPSEKEVVVGDLAPGEAATFAFDAAVNDSAVAGSRQFTVRMHYRANNQRWTSKPLDVPANVSEKRNSFNVTLVNASIESGGNSTLLLRLTNVRQIPLYDVSASMNLAGPLSSGEGTSFVERLGPGETKTLIFDARATENIRAKTYAAKVDVRYATADGGRRNSDAYWVPARITFDEDSDGSEKDDGGGQNRGVFTRNNLSLFAIGIGALLIALTAIAYYRQE